MEKEDTNDRGTLESDKIQENYDAAFDEAQGIGAPIEPPPAKTEAEGNQDLVNSISPDNTPENKDSKPVEQDKTPAPLKIQGKEAPPDAPKIVDEEKAEQKWRTLQGIHKHDKETWEQKEREYQEQLEKLKAAPVKPAEPPKDAKSVPVGKNYDDLSDEDKAALKEYDEEFDTISKMEALKRQAELTKIRKEFQDAIVAITQAVAPAITVGNEVSQSKHFDTIRAVHNDFETYRDDGTLKSWIDSKPAYLKNAYEKAYNEGVAEEVIDLITNFKKENNIGNGNSDPLHSNTPNPKKEEKKAALSVVTNRRGAVNLVQNSTDDFEGAFDEAMAR